MIARLLCRFGFHRLLKLQVIDATQPHRRPRVIFTPKCTRCGFIPAFPNNPKLKGE
jgi:hypothetical protein